MKISSIIFVSGSYRRSIFIGQPYFMPFIFIRHRHSASIIVDYLRCSSSSTLRTYTVHCMVFFSPAVQSKQISTWSSAVSNILLVCLSQKFVVWRQLIYLKLCFILFNYKQFIQFYCLKLFNYLFLLLILSIDQSFK